MCRLDNDVAHPRNGGLCEPQCPRQGTTAPTGQTQRARVLLAVGHDEPGTIGGTGGTGGSGGIGSIGISPPPPPGCLPGGGALVAAKGTLFSGVVGWFDGGDCYQVTIYWGDGTSSAGTLTPTIGGYLVSGTHIYAEEGPWPAALLVVDLDTGRDWTVVVYALVLAIQDDTQLQSGFFDALPYEPNVSQVGSDVSRSFSLLLPIATAARHSGASMPRIC